MSKKPKLYEPVEPPKVLRARRVHEYDELINAISKEVKGWYRINIPDRKPSTVYVALAKRLKGRNDLKLHYIKGIVYIEKL